MRVMDTTKRDRKELASPPMSGCRLTTLCPVLNCLQAPDELPERMVGLTRCIRFDLAANETVVSEHLIDADAERQVAEVRWYPE